MRFANFAANTSISVNESENFPRFEQLEDARLVDRDSVNARSCLFATDYKHWESKGKRATKTEECYLLLLRWISFHGILSNSIQSPPQRKALSVSSPFAHPTFLSPSLSLSLSRVFPNLAKDCDSDSYISSRAQRQYNRPVDSGRPRLCQRLRRGPLRRIQLLGAMRFSFLLRVSAGFLERREKHFSYTYMREKKHATSQ